MAFWGRQHPAQARCQQDGELCPTHITPQRSDSSLHPVKYRGNSTTPVWLQVLRVRYSSSLSAGHCSVKPSEEVSFLGQGVTGNNCFPQGRERKDSASPWWPPSPVSLQRAVFCENKRGASYPKEQNKTCQRNVLSAHYEPYSAHQKCEKHPWTL